MSAARILVVDDDDGVRNVAERQLRSLGHEVIAASSGEEALALLDATADVDLLFVDVSMPGIGGVEVAGRALRSRPQLKVLFASGNFDSGALSGAAQFIVKPYRKKDLAEKLNEVLGA
ncbi:MAG TPA: response regulator [Reyranella sp.]|nr:response regulator [Reyranella sp.]